MSGEATKASKPAIIPCVWDNEAKCLVRVYSHRGVDILTAPPPITLNLEDFTEPGPLIDDVLTQTTIALECEQVNVQRLHEALKIARIALYDVSIAPGGLVHKTYRDRATRAIVQINALKLDGG